MPHIIISTSRAAEIIIKVQNLKLKKKIVLTSLKWVRKITGISDYVRKSTFCVRWFFNIQNWSVIFLKNVSALQLFDSSLQQINQKWEENENYKILDRCNSLNYVSFSNFNVTVWPRSFLKWPNLKCHMGHRIPFD